jgi:hypothetical protein
MNNKMGGYLPSFLAFVGLEIGIGLLCAFLLPASLNKKPVVSNEQFDNLDKNSAVQVQTSWFYKNRRVVFTLLSLTIVNYFSNFKQSFMTTYIEETGRVTEDNLGKIVALAPFF